jgi:hypothetical protein
MPNPNPDETKSQFLKRCIPTLIRDENRPHKQSIAICANMFDRYKNKVNVVPLSETYELINEALSVPTKVDVRNYASSAILPKVGSILNPGTIAVATSISPELGQLATQFANVLPPSTYTSLNTNDKSINPGALTQTTIGQMKKPSSANLAKFDDRSINNKILRPQGVVICDTINNPFFPIDAPSIDSSKFNLPDIKSKYQTFYTTLPVDFLPWHYVVEILNGKYYFFQTRPLDMRFPLNNIECKDLLNANSSILNTTPSTDMFFKNQPFDIGQAIHVCILGDTNLDVYIDSLYEMIGRMCIGPILRYFKLPSSINLRVINLNLGKKFLFEKLELYTKR